MRSNDSPCTPHRPRLERDLERAQRAAVAARSTTDNGARPALAAALAAIEAAFDRAAIVNDLKIAVERHIRRGAEHPAVRARFVARSRAAAHLRSRRSHRHDRAMAARRATRLRDRQRLRARQSPIAAGAGRAPPAAALAAVQTPSCGICERTHRSVWPRPCAGGRGVSPATRSTNAAANRRTSRRSFQIFLARHRCV
jgi:hypothetical protein